MKQERLCRSERTRLPKFCRPGSGQCLLDENNSKLTDCVAPRLITEKPVSFAGLARLLNEGSTVKECE